MRTSLHERALEPKFFDNEEIAPQLAAFSQYRRVQIVVDAE
ncbi:MAG TPA: hypothetical protein VM735_05000 [Candidatus Kapabacteria bacterium]|nr:hypothetical protein [Candidatus Kapabacteria bacterium]